VFLEIEDLGREKDAGAGGDGSDAMKGGGQGGEAAMRKRARDVETATSSKTREKRPVGESSSQWAATKRSTPAPNIKAPKPTAIRTGQRNWPGFSLEASKA
jgi:hypothetical protein